MPSFLDGVGDQLGKATDAHLDALAENGYTRTHAVSGYRRVNPFQVESGSAEDPATWSASGPHSLDDWTGYNQATLNAGTQLAHGLVPAGADLSWSLPAGYNRDAGHLTQKVYVKGTGQTSKNVIALAVNPFSTPDATHTVGDVTSFSVPLASFEDAVVAIGVKVEWDDSVQAHENADSTAYVPAAGEDPLTGAGRGICVGPIPDDVPEITSITQTPSDFQCQNGSDIQIHVNLGTIFGSVFLREAVDGGAFGSDFAHSPSLTRESGHTYTYQARYAGGAYSASTNHFLRCDLL